MAEDHRNLRNIQHIMHHLFANMAEVNLHADPVHFADHIATEFGEAIVLRFIGCAVGPRHIARMRERHVARTKIVHLAQNSQARSNRVPTLHAYE